MFIRAADISILSGLGRHERPQSKADKGLVLGRDLSGTVLEVGSHVGSLRVGDSVWALVPLLTRSGSLSDFVVLRESLVRKKPAKVGHEGAATVPYSGVMAWKALHEAGIQPNATSKACVQHP